MRPTDKPGEVFAWYVSPSVLEYRGVVLSHDRADVLNLELSFVGHNVQHPAAVLRRNSDDPRLQGKPLRSACKCCEET